MDSSFDLACHVRLYLSLISSRWPHPTLIFLSSSPLMVLTSLSPSRPTSLLFPHQPPHLAPSNPHEPRRNSIGSCLYGDGSYTVRDFSIETLMLRDL